MSKYEWIITGDGGGYWKPLPPKRGICERCGKRAVVEEIPLMGYSEELCHACAAAAYHIGEAV